MLIGLGTGSVGTGELARLLSLPHERHWLPWEWDLAALDAALPEIVGSGGEVGLYFLPYVAAILERVPAARFVCMQRDAGRTTAGLTRKLGRNPFGVWEDHLAYERGFPYFGGVTLEEGAARYVRAYYAEAYRLQKRFPQSFRIFFTDHLLGNPGEGDVHFKELCESVQSDFEAWTQPVRSAA